LTLDNFGLQARTLILTEPKRGSWTEANIGLSGRYVSAIDTSGNKIFAGTNLGLSLLTNNGESKTSLNNGLSNPDVMSFAINGNNIFIGTYYTGVYYSTNSGDNWTNTGLSNQTVYSLALYGNHLFAGTDSGVYMSSEFVNRKSFCYLESI